MKNFFILGRNPSLSKTEIFEFLKARNRTFKEILFEKNILLIETPGKENFNIQDFGGTIHIGEIIFEGDEKKLSLYLKNNELIPSDKFSYATHGNVDPQILKDKFKQEKKKASQKHGGKFLKFQDGEKIENPKADFQIFLHKKNNTVYLGIASQTYNSSEVEKRDMQKPQRRESLAISPRLAKILINISGAKQNQLLLDPFCGIGTILSEAMIKNIKVYGIDKDPEAIKSAEENLEWLTKQYKIQVKYRIENNNSRKAPDMQFNAIATETPLGKLLRKKPADNEAKQIIQNFEALIIPILIRLKKIKKPHAKIAITFPVIRGFHVDTKKITEKTGLKIYIKPIPESRLGQFISRDILVFQ